MKRVLLCCLTMVVIGCGQPQPIVKEPEVTAFQKSLAAVADEGQRLINLVEIGTSVGELNAQLARVRHGVAGLSAADPKEQERVQTARALLSELEMYSLRAASLPQEGRNIKHLSENTPEFLAIGMEEAYEEHKKDFANAKQTATKLIGQLR